MMQTKQTTNAGDAFAEKYPNIAEWTTGGGLIELGYDENTNSFVRALDEGGFVWQGVAEYETMDAAFEALNAGLADWYDENG